MSDVEKNIGTHKPEFAGEWVRLGDVIKKAKSARCGSDSYPILSITMRDGIVEQASRFKKSIASRDTGNYKVVEPGQLVVGFPIDEGVIYVQNFNYPGIMSPAYDVWDIDSSRVDPSYLELALHSPQSMDYYRSNLRGTTARRRSLPTNTLCDLTFLLPSLENQRIVVKRMSMIVTLLDDAGSRLSALDNLVKSQFVEMFGDPRLNTKEWPLVKLGDVASTRLGKMLDAKKQTGLEARPYLANTDVQWFRFNLENLKTMDFDAGDRKEFALRDGDVLATEGGEVGRCAIWHCELEECYFQKAVHRIRCDSERLLPIFLAWTFKMKSERNLFGSYVSRSTIAHLTGEKLRKVPIQLPPLALQQQFADFVARVDKLGFDVQQQIEKLETLKQSLMQEYFG